jgi:DNA-directed RNA polymerase specialized sigma24 family protein
LRRHQAEQVVARAAFLPPADRLLIELYLDQGRTLKDIAASCGVPPRVMSRRMRKLILRLASDRYAFVVRHMETWPLSRRRVAVAMVLHGLSIRESAQVLSMSLYVVRRHHENIATLFEADQRPATSRPLAKAT